jgi:hypothetical protein
MSDISSQERSTDDTSSKRKASKYLKYGCGIGCGVIVLFIIIIVGIGYYLIKDSVVAFKETEASMKRLIKEYGRVQDFCPESDGAIKPDRVKAFLQVRESLIPIVKDMKQSLVHIIDGIDRAEDEGSSFWSMVGIIKDISRTLPHLAKYFTARNRKLMDVGMGLGEYYYIYVVAYYSWLGISPGDGPDFHFLGEGGKKSSFYFAMEEMVKDKDAKEDAYDKESWETQGIGTIGRVRGFILPMIQRQLKKLKESTTGENLEPWQKALEGEIKALKKDRQRLPWQDGLPEVLEASLQPFRKRLEACYPKLVNPLEFGLSKD